ncbi:hypothetical protein SUGI_0909910 [Cryptomeria japonica]|nr:hypothetical protein SUGI_0909910 [Cryptomeria japonica]
MEDSNPIAIAVLEQEKRENGVVLILPEPNQDDPLVGKKKAILSERSINLIFHLHDKDLVSPKPEEDTLLEQIIRAARILQLNEAEWYFMEDDDFGPFSPRNEMEALYLIYSITNDLCANSGENIDILHALQTATVNKINFFANLDGENIGGLISTGETERELLEWASTEGVKSKLNIADFEGYGRGTIATADLNVGDIALEIPKLLIICEDSVLRSDMRQVLENTDELASETTTLLWSMRERHRLQSEFRPYFASLPKSFNTGLSFGIQALTALEGTLLLEEIVQAKEHLRAQYENLCSTLFTRNPEIFPPEFCTWDHFLWACELWYSNSMKVSFPDNKLKTCLVPVAGLLNHSLYPHVMHYGRVDPKSDTLKLYVSRPCKYGQQCFLSYGPLPSSHLVTFYGFLLRGDNVYDTIPIDLDLPQQLDLDNHLLGDVCDQICHMVRGTWLSKSKRNKYGLPSRLLAALRTAFLDEDDLRLQQQNLRYAVISKENEAAVLEGILSVLQPMLESIDQSDELTSEDQNWDWSTSSGFNLN